MEWVTLTIPRPPSVNAAYRNVSRAGGKGTGRVKTARTKEWEAAAMAAISRQCPRSIAGKYVIEIGVQRPDNRRRDIFNLVKLIEDVLVKCNVIEDDSLCEIGLVYWRCYGEDVFVHVAPHEESMTDKIVFGEGMNYG